MKPLRIFSPNLQLLAEIDDYESLIITRKWHTYGEITLTIHQDKKHVDKLINGNILLPGADFKSASVIRYRESDLDTLTVKAPFLGSYLAQRLIVPDDPVSGNAESVMKTFVDTQAVNPVNPFPDVERDYFLLPFHPTTAMWRKPFREFRNMRVAPDLGRGLTVTRQGKYQKLSDELESISRQSGLGWGVYLDNGLVFEVFECNDRTVAGNSPVIFSPEFDNVMQQGFVESQFEQINAVYASNDLEVVDVGDSFGAERFEHFVKTDENLEDYARREMQEPVFALEAEAIESSFRYRVDWDLGDLVTIQNKKWNIERTARITEVEEVYEPSNIRINVTFGESQPTIVDKVKSEIKRLGGI